MVKLFSLEYVHVQKKKERNLLHHNQLQWLSTIFIKKNFTFYFFANSTTQSNIIIFYGEKNLFSEIILL